MKKIIKRIIMLFLLTTILSTNSFAVDSELIPNDETGIPDSHLYKSILTSIAISKRTSIVASDFFTKEEATALTKLWNFYMENPRSLKGIGHLSNLQLLDLTYYKSSDGFHYEGYNPSSPLDIQGIENLKKLGKLYITDYSLSDLSRIERLTSLTTIGIIGCAIENCYSLRNLINLQNLNLDRNSLKSLQGMENLTNLTTVSFKHNFLTKKEIVSKCPKHLTSNQAWLNTQVKSQRIFKKLTMRKRRKITTKTKRVEGKTDWHAREVRLMKGKRIISRVYVDTTTRPEIDGYTLPYTFKKLNLKKFAGKKMIIKATNGVMSKTIKFTVRRKRK